MKKEFNNNGCGKGDDKIRNPPFNLSDEIVYHGKVGYFIPEEHVKEFIKILLEEIERIKPKPQDPSTMLNQGWVACCEKITYEIKQRAGEKLK